jgi:hypothetical protein
LYILIFIFLDSKRKAEGSGLNGNKHYPNSISSKFAPESGYPVLKTINIIAHCHTTVSPHSVFLFLSHVLGARRHPSPASAQADQGRTVLTIGSV